MLRAALAEADPIGTDLSHAERLDEYSLEAKEIEKKLKAGQSIDRAIAVVFEETCGLDLHPETVREIVAEFEAVSRAAD